MSILCSDSAKGSSWNRATKFAFELYLAELLPHVGRSCRLLLSVAVRRDSLEVTSRERIPRRIYAKLKSFLPLSCNKQPFLFSWVVEAEEQRSRRVSVLQERVSKSTVMFRRAAAPNRWIKGVAAAASVRRVSTLRWQRDRPAPAPSRRLGLSRIYFRHTGAASLCSSNSSSCSCCCCCGGGGGPSARENRPVATTTAADGGADAATGAAAVATGLGGGRPCRDWGLPQSEDMDRRGVGTARTFKAPAATAAPPPPTTTTTTKAARATTAATAAAAAAASGSSSVVGVAEVALGGGGSGDDDRRYRAPDSNLRGKFVAEPLPSPTVKVTTQQRRAFYYREQCQTLCYKYFHPVKDCSGKGMKVKNIK